MRYPQEFSAQSIKQKASSLPDTYYGEECNVSLNSRYVTQMSAADGEPLRFDNLGISLCCRGTVSSELNLNGQTAEAGDFELIYPGTIYRLKEISDDCEIIGIALSPLLLEEVLRDEDVHFFSKVGRNIRVRLEKGEKGLFRQMATVYLHSLQRYGEGSKLCRDMTACILQFAQQVCSSERIAVCKSASRADELCNKFIAQLSQSRGTKRTIGWFAENLCVSKHYLSIAVKKSSGQSVKDIIDNAVIMEIKVLLRHSGLSVSQIADKLEFSSSTFLCKYFRAKTGITPLQYRRGR